MNVIINYTESPIEGRGFRNEFLSKSLGNCVTISGSWSHTKKTRIDLPNPDNHYFLKNLSYYKNVGFRRLFSGWHFAFLLRKALSGKKIQNCIVSSINIEVLFFLRKKNIDTLIIDVRDIWPDAHPLSLKSWPFYLYYNLLNRILIPRAQKCIYVSPTFEEWLIKNKLIDKAHYLPLCFDENRWEKSFQRQQNNKISNHKVIVGYVGNLNMQFSLLDFINTLETNKNIYLEIIGGGPGLKELLSKISEESNKRVINHGYLDRETTTEKMSNWNYGIVPQSSYSKADFPNKFFDYLGTGIPCIAFRGTFLGGYIEKKSIGFTIERHQDKQINFVELYNYYKKNVSNIRNSYVAQKRYVSTLRKVLK